MTEGFELIQGKARSTPRFKLGVSGQWTAEGASPRFGDLIATEMHCGPTMEEESRFLASIAGATSYTVAGDVLLLGSPKGGLLFEAR